MRLKRSRILRGRDAFLNLRNNGKVYHGKFLKISIFQKPLEPQQAQKQPQRQYKTSQTSSNNEKPTKSFRQKNEKNIIGSKPSCNLKVNLKFGFMTPKFIGKANVRNKVRRRLREIARTNANLISPKNNYQSPEVHILTIAKKNAISANYSQLKLEWRNLLTKAKLISN